MLNANNPTSCEPESPPNDFPRNLLARVVKADGQIIVEQVCPTGDIQFCIPLLDAGLRRAALSQYSLTHSTFFINLVGEVLVRKNIRQFAEILGRLSPGDYHRAVNAHQHRHFGFYIDEHDVVHIQFHGSLIQQIMTEDIENVLMDWLS